MAKVYADGGVWYAEWYVLDPKNDAFARQRRSTRIKVDGTASAKQRAKVIADGFEKAAPTARSKSTKTLTDAFEAREQALRVRQAAKKSIERFENARARIFDFFGRLSWAGELTKYDLRRYADARMHAGITPDGVRRELIELRASCHEAGLARPDLPDLPAPVSREGFTTKVDVLRICDELPPHQAKIVLLVNQTGLRRNEVYRLKWLSPGQGRLIGKRDGLKTGHRTIPLTPIAEKILQTGPLRKWVNALRGLKNAARRAGVGKVNWNDLRAGTATQLLQADVAPARIAALLGHTSLRMVEQRYARLKNLKVSVDDLKSLATDVD